MLDVEFDKIILTLGGQLNWKDDNMNGYCLLKLTRQTISKQLIFSIVFFFLATPFLFSCGGGGSGDTSNNTINDTDLSGTIQLNTDPQDPEVAILTGNPYGDRLIFYGVKNSEGDVLQIQTMQYYMPGESKPWNIEIDEAARPTRIATHVGSVYTFTYMNNKLTVNCRDNEGNLYSEDFSLSDVDLPLIDNSLLQTANVESVYNPLEDSIVTMEIVKGSVRTHIENPLTNADLGNVNVDELTIVASNHEGNIPYTHIGKGEYRFAATHRTADLNVLTAQCEAKYSTRSTVLSVLGFVAGVVSLLIAAKLAPIAALYGVSSAGFGAFSINATVDSWDCKDLLRSGLVDMGVGKQSVEVKTVYRGKDRYFIEKYDLFDLTDDINNDRSFSTTISYPVTPVLTSVTTIPASPKVGESYEVNVQATIPQGGFIEWEWQRSEEGGADSGEWTNEDENIDVNRRFGPFTGADEKTTDFATFLLYTIENNEKVRQGAIFQAIHISDEQSIVKCPEGYWSVKTMSLKYDGECDPHQFSWGDFEIKSDGHWVSSRGDIETDETSAWTLNGNKIVLEGKPTGYCSREYYEGTVLDIGSGCARIEGKVYKKCNFDGPFTLVDCFEAELVQDQ